MGLMKTIPSLFSEGLLHKVLLLFIVQLAKNSTATNKTIIINIDKAVTDLNNKYKLPKNKNQYIDSIQFSTSIMQHPHNSSTTIFIKNWLNDKSNIYNNNVNTAVLTIVIFIDPQKNDL